jgi:hypothetical protein
MWGSSEMLRAKEAVKEVDKEERRGRTSKRNKKGRYILRRR